MFVIEVIPLKRGIQVETLSYYSALPYKEGTLLTIPLRNKVTTAIVTGIKPVSAAKTALKTATFSLRKLTVQKDAVRLPESLIYTAQKLSAMIPANLGSILFAMIPPDIRDGERLYPKTTYQINKEDATPRILTDTCKNRYIAYKSQIRQTFAHCGSVVFVVPTSAEVDQAKKKLEVGIENRVVTFSSTHTKKQLSQSYSAFEDLRQAKLIITTPSFAFLDRHDITTLIVESSGSSNYQQRNRPYLDVREVLKVYAKESGRSILFGDAIPRTEDEIKRRDDTYTTYDEHTMRLELSGTLTIATHTKIENGDHFSLCTRELKEIITRSLSSRSHAHVYLHAARRGLAPAVMCYDCGFIFRCPDSGAPYSLLRTFNGDQEERWFLSGTSGKRVRAVDVCSNCGSWRLREQGIGIQQVHDEIRRLFPQIDITVFDHTTATTYAKAKKLIDKFYTTSHGILIGTTMTLPYLEKSVDISAVMSYEATRAIPTWRADETIFALLIKLREITEKDVVVQTRTEPDELLQLASRGLIDQFYDGEISIRQALQYPPYMVFILLSWVGTKEQTKEIEASLQEKLKGNEIQFYCAPQSESTKTIRYGLLRTDANTWPNAVLVAKLRELPPNIKIEINPDRIV
jgi:primosomal protein N'